MTTTIDNFREGDVVHYTPTNSWCRERYAIAKMTTLRQPKLVLRDTYWGTMSDSACLSSDEIVTAELLFNLNEVEPVASPELWRRYREEDRLIYTSQHGLTRHRFVPRGAQYNRDAELDLQRQLVADAIAKRDSAISDITWNRQRYHEMLADPTVTPFAY